MSVSEPAFEPWPEAELECRRACLLCASPRRTRLHADLRDKVFRCAPGVWTLWRCDDCAAAWLDPRPESASMARAYSAYYTHSAAGARARLDNSAQTGMQGLVQRFRNGELNRRFGYRREPALRPRRLSPIVACLLPDEVARLGRHVRQLPPPRTADARLLDVGAGNGDFLAVAETLDYRAEGLEADANAVAFAHARGLAMKQGALPGVPLEPGAYEQITLNHVIEHLHDPLGVLRELHAALAPGGRIWIQTPNLEACGHAEFGADWRGLEPPRHLVLFNEQALRRALEAAGFRNIELLAPAPEAKSYYRRSLAIAQGLPPESGENPHWSRAWKRRARRADRRAKRDPGVGESVTLIARR